MKHCFLIIIPMFILLSCSDNFSANGPYTPQLIVYSVLDASTDTQYVRVYSSFSPESYRPGMTSPTTSVSGAVVTVADDSMQFSFRDTMVSVLQDDGTTNQQHLFYSIFRPREKKRYTLTVQSPNYPTAVSNAEGLESSQTIMFATKPLFEPVPGMNITFDVYLGKNVSAYLTIFTIHYEVLINSVWQPRFKEVPINIVVDASGTITKRFHAVPQLYTITASIDRNIKINYPTEIYSAMIKEIKDENKQLYATKELRFKNVTFTVTQFDNQIFTYYSIANNFPGATTIRLDEPDYSNVQNGFGIFGAVTAQQKTYGIPSDFP